MFVVLDNVDVNLALNKSASQSTTSDDGKVASLAVNGLYDIASCTANTQVHPWWTVDLELAYDIGHVTVTNNPGTYRTFCITIQFVGEGASAREFLFGRSKEPFWRGSCLITLLCITYSDSC